MKSALFTFFTTLVFLSAAFPHNAPYSPKKCKPRPSTTGIPLPGPSDISANNASGSGGPADGQRVIQVQSTCGPIGASPITTQSSGPNGGENWLLCGFTSDGWRPDMVRLSDLIYVPLKTAINYPNSPFAACEPFIDLFELYGQQFGIPDIMLASFAMQESSCNPGAVGAAQEQGLMQIKWDKCVDAPNHNCQDPEFNIKAGALFFSNLLEQTGGNVVLAVGLYNGFSPGITLSKASEYGQCPFNFDYIFQFLNGWLQNINAHDPNNILGIYRNCP